MWDRCLRLFQINSLCRLQNWKWVKKVLNPGATHDNLWLWINQSLNVLWLWIWKCETLLSWQYGLKHLHSISFNCFSLKQSLQWKCNRWCFLSVYQWTVCHAVSVSQWRIAFLPLVMSSEAWQHDTRDSSQRAAIQSHVAQHRKHSAVYRKCLMKECGVCLDSVTDDDFSWFLSF